MDAVLYMPYTGSMTSQQARAFLMTVEKGSFSEAALELGVNQSSVSYAITQLEKEFGVRLLERGRFGAAPTEVGARMAEHLRKMLQFEEAAVQEASLSGGELTGTLRVLTFSTIEAAVMPRLIVELRKRYPKLSVKPVSAERVKPSTVLEFEDVLLNGLADVGFTNDSPEQRQDLIYWQLMPDPYLLVLREGGEAANSVSVTSLTDTPVVVAGPGIGCPVRIQAFLQEHLGKEEPDYWTEQFDGLFRMVAEGVGVGIAPGLACRELPDGVTTVPFSETFERQVLLAVSPGNLKIPAVRAFVSVLKEFFPESELPDLSVRIPNAVGGS
jgi:DNA-binding transcriptional LysR family regulator